MSKKHPSTELLSAYAAGNLSLSQSLCVAAHVENCVHCQLAVGKLQNLAAHYFEEQATNNIEVSDTLRESVFSSLDKADTREAIQTQTEIQHPELPRCINKMLPNDFSELKWEKVNRNVTAAKLFTDTSGELVQLYRVKAGKSAGKHGHKGEEINVVLCGSFTDNGMTYKKGDFAYSNHDIEHEPVASSEQDCICLTVTTAPVKVSGMLARIINPLIERQFNRFIKI